MSFSGPTDQTHVPQAAVNALLIEIWTLFMIGLAVTWLRTYARVRAVGFKDLRADDYIVWLGVVCFPLGF